MKARGPEAKAPAKGRAGNRWRRPFVIGLGMALAVALGGMGFALRSITRTFYTDADTINEPATTAKVRDILWQPPTRLPDLINTTSDEYEPRLSADGLTLFFVRGKAGKNADIYHCTRTPEGWSAPEPLREINTEYDELGAEPSADGRSLYFYSDRPGGGGYDLWVAHRGLDGRSGFTEAVNLGPAINSEFNDYGPALARDGRTLYFASNRPQVSGVEQPDPDGWPGTIREDPYHRTYDLYMATITEHGPGQARAIDVLNTAYNEGAPTVSPFGDFVYFASDRPGGQGAYDLYRTRRLDGGHEPATNLGAAVNTPANELDPGLTMGGYALYFSSDRPAERLDPDTPNPYHVYQTTSREVFTRTESHQASIDWAAIWAAIGPNLLWALLALLLLLLMLSVLRDARSRKLSLLARCLLASLAAHVSLMLLFNVWEVTTSLVREFGRRGRIQIALVASSHGKDIVSQIRGEFTDVPTPEPVGAAVRRRSPPVEIRPRPTMATLNVQSHSIEINDRVRPPWKGADAVVPPSGIPTSERQVAETLARTSLEVPLPAEQVQVSDAKRASRALPERVTSVIVSRPVVHGSLAVRAQAAPPPALAPASHSGLLPPVSQRSLAEASPPPDANCRTRYSTAVTAATASLDRLPTLVVTLPPEPQSRSHHEESSSSATPVVAHAVEPVGRTRVKNVTGGDVGDALREVSPVARPSSTETASLVRPHSAPHGPEARLTSSSARPSEVAETAPPKMPFAKLSLPALEESARTVQEESTKRPDRVALDGVRSSTAALAALRDRESMSLFRVPPVEHQLPAVRAGRLADCRSDAREAQPSATADAGPTPPRGDARIPDAPPLSVRLPTEVVLPDNAYVQRERDRRLDVAEGMGGSEETEHAVGRALRWLATHQSRDGRWDGDGFDDGCGACGGETDVAVDVALTGLSLLCFLAADHTHTDQGPYRNTVERALNWLISRQKPNGDLRGDETMYSHGIATIALAEAYGMSRDSQLREPVRRAVAFIERARNGRTGIWRYDPGQPGDTSVLGWQIMALASAKEAGVAVPMEPFLAARRWLDAVSSPRHPGLYAYQPGRQATAPMTAEGLFIQQILGRRPDEPRMRESIELLLRNLPSWDEEPNTYYWYYGTLAMFHHQGEPWRRWNTTLADQLLAHQRKNGPPAGSWDPDGEWAEVGGRVYQTALCTLMLEVYYRYLPLFLRERPEGAIGTIRGYVTDGVTGQPLSDARVRLDLPDRAPVEVVTRTDGGYRLYPPKVPAFFALSASREGYAPTSKNVAAVTVHGTTLELHFELQPETEGEVAIEAVPHVHHLGDDAFSGKINSQFQKQSEGSRFRAVFQLTATQRPPYYTAAEVTMLVKGVQMDHRIRINNEVIQERLNDAPDDGSFGVFRAAFTPDLLKVGANTIEILASSRGDDVDDFEFVNLRIRLLR